MGKTKEKPAEKPKPAEKLVSLHPLKFKEAVTDLLKVKPNRRSGDPEEEGEADSG